MKCPNVFEINKRKGVYTILLLVVFAFLNKNCTFNKMGQDKNNTTNTGSLPHQDPEFWKKEAEAMVNTQIIARGILDQKLTQAMKNTPRHLFVPRSWASHAYDDSPQPIGEGQTISQPYIVALMTSLLQLTGKEKVLEIGTGSGYQAAILSQLAAQCFSIELIPSLADTARTILKKLDYNNVTVKCDDGYQGWAEHAPFDAIIITAAPEEIPLKLVAQLKTGGKMVVPVGTHSQELQLLTKTKKKLKKETIIPVRFVPMVKPK